MIDTEMIEAEMQIMYDFHKVQALKEKIIQHGKLNEARKTGEKYQKITEDDKKIIIDCIDEIYTLVGRISNNALLIQAKMVTTKQEFLKSLQAVEGDDS